MGELDWLDARAAHLAGRRRQGGKGGDEADEPRRPRVSERHDLLLHLIYRDSSGDESERTVHVREVFRRDGVIFLGGHCFLRNQTRVFRGDRIVTLANGRTGELIVGVRDFIEMLAPEADKAFAAMGYREGAPLAWSGSDATRLRQRARPLAILMMSLAKADGEWHPEEVKVLDALVGEISAALSLKPDARSRARMVGEFSAIVPSGNLVTRAAKAILADRSAYGDAPAWCRRMIEADGRTHPEELHEFRAIVARLAELSG